MKPLALFVCLLSTACALAQGGAVTAVPTITNTRGEPVPYAQVAVCASNPGSLPLTVCNGNFATIYTDITVATACTNNVSPIHPISGVGCTNPGKSDGLGNVIAFAPAGQYWCQYSGGSITRPIVVPCFFANGGGSANLNCPSALNGSIGAFTAPTAFSCDPNFFTDFHGNWTSQSGRTIGPVNGFLGLTGGGASPGSNAIYKLGVNEFRWLARTGSAEYVAPPATLCTAGQVWGVLSSGTDGNGDTVQVMQCQTASAASITATLPIVVTPSPITGTGVISCPTCGTVTFPLAADPSAPVVTNGGTPGATTYSYTVVGNQDGASVFHSKASAVGTTTTGNATLSSTNFNLLKTYADTLYGYRCYDIYRTAGGATQGKIATCAGKAFKDTGAAGNGATAPSTNNTELDPTGLLRAGNACNSMFHSAEGIDAPPCSPTLFDNELTNTWDSPGGVSDGIFTLTNHGSETWAWTGGTISVLGDSVGGANYRFQGQSLSGIATPYTIVTYLYFNSIVGSDCSLALRESGTGKLTEIGIQQNQGLGGAAGGGLVFIVRNWTNTTTVGSTVNFQNNQSPAAYLYITNDGTNLTYKYSYDGLTPPVTFLSQTVVTAFTTAPDQAGVSYSPAQAVAAGTVCKWDYLRQ